MKPCQTTAASRVTQSGVVSPSVRVGWPSAGGWGVMVVRPGSGPGRRRPCRRRSMSAGSTPPRWKTAGGPGLDVPGLGPGHPAGLFVGGEDGAHGALVGRDDVGGQATGEGQELVVGDDVVDESPLEGLAGVDEVARWRSSPGPADADGLGQGHGQAPQGVDADPGVGVGEAGPLRGHQEIAVEGQLEAAGHGHAVDGPDDRLGRGKGGRRPRTAGARSPSALRTPLASRGALEGPPSWPSSFRSSPAQKAGSAPVRMRTSTSSRASASPTRRPRAADELASTWRCAPRAG